MTVKYLSDEKGKITAVQLPIEEWEIIKSKYPQIDQTGASLPGWHKDIIDARLETIQKHPELIKPIAALMAEIDK